MAQANSLREICGGKLNHLGVEAAPGKSNLSYANQHRDPEIFKASVSMFGIPFRVWLSKFKRFYGYNLPQTCSFSILI